MGVISDSDRKSPSREGPLKQEKSKGWMEQGLNLHASYAMPPVVMVSCNIECKVCTL